MMYVVQYKFVVANNITSVACKNYKSKNEKAYVDEKARWPNC